MLDLKTMSWADLTTNRHVNAMTPIETAKISDLDPLRRYWRNHGYVVLERFLPEELIDRYCAVREKLPKPNEVVEAARQRADYLGGWSYPTPFMISPELRDLALYAPLMRIQHELIGFPMGLNLALTGWVSTERNWHQDAYLNPDHLGNYYIAAWMALDDIDENAGPFEFIDGSNNWPVMSRERLFSIMPREWHNDPLWPTKTQDDVARVSEQEIEQRGAKISKFVPKRGDILLWHASLLHRGSPPKDRTLLRKSLICHYSSVAHRIDMPKIARHTNGQMYFDLPCDGRVK